MRERDKVENNYASISSTNRKLGSTNILVFFMAVLAIFQACCSFGKKAASDKGSRPGVYIM